MNDTFTDRSGGLSVVHLDHSREAGGAELGLLRIVRAARNWHPRVAVPGSAELALGVFEPLRTLRGVDIAEIGPEQAPGASRSAGGLLAKARFAAALLRQSAALRFSKAFRSSTLVHANTSRSGVYGAIACLTSRKPYVVHLRDMVTAESLGGIGFALFTRVALRRADGIISNSHATLASALPYARKSALSDVIASAIGITERAPYLPPRPTVRTIGMVARIDAWKGQDVLLEAFAQAFKGSETRLVFVGGASFGLGAELDALKAQAERLGVASQVDFTGHVTDVGEQIARLDICVQASTRPEPLGQNVLQYLAAGKPVVAVNAGGPAEWIQNGHNGLLTPLGDAQALASALRRLTDDHELRTEVAEAAYATPGIATDSEIAEQHGQFFARVAANKRGGSVSTS